MEPGSLRPGASPPPSRPALPSGEAAPRDGGRRKRTSFSKAQLELLVRTFEKQPYPGIALREQLSGLTDIPESRIQVWFQNRRARQLNRKKSEAALRPRPAAGSQPRGHCGGGCPQRCPLPRGLGPEQGRLAQQPALPGGGQSCPGQPLPCSGPQCVRLDTHCRSSDGAFGAPGQTPSHFGLDYVGKGEQFGAGTMGSSPQLPAQQAQDFPYLKKPFPESCYADVFQPPTEDYHYLAAKENMYRRPVLNYLNANPGLVDENFLYIKPNTSPFEKGSVPSCEGESVPELKQVRHSPPLFAASDASPPSVPAKHEGGSQGTCAAPAPPYGQQLLDVVNDYDPHWLGMRNEVLGNGLDFLFEQNGEQGGPKSYLYALGSQNAACHLGYT